MLTFLVQRVAQAVVTVWAIVTITFFLALLAPGDPAELRSEKVSSPAALANWRHEHGLDLPPFRRYVRYFAGVVHGDLGRSFRNESDPPIAYFLREHFPVTALLATLAIIGALGVGLVVGVCAALNHNGWMDRALMGLILTGVSVPNFVLGPVLIAFFALKLNWLPVAGWGYTEDMVLPVIVLAARPAALIARMARASMIDTLRQDYIRAARARGISQTRVVLVHALKNAFLPVLTSAGVSFGYLLSGSFVVESIFAIPGVGQASFNSITERDYSLIQGTTILLATIFVAINLLIDLLYATIDPRVRLTGRQAEA